MTKEQLTKEIVKLGIELERKKAELEKLTTPARVTELRGIMDRCKNEFDSLTQEIARIGKRRHELNATFTAAKNELAKLEVKQC
jgi:hypothetical protein